MILCDVHPPALYFNGTNVATPELTASDVEQLQTQLLFKTGAIVEGGLTESRSKESVESDLLHHSNKGEIVSGERM